MEYYSVIKKYEIMPSAATWMGLEIIILSEASQKEKDKYDITYLWKLKNDTNELIYEIDSHRCRKQIYGYQRERRVGEGIN